MPRRPASRASPSVVAWSPTVSRPWRRRCDRRPRQGDAGAARGRDGRRHGAPRPAANGWLAHPPDLTGLAVVVHHPGMGATIDLEGPTPTSAAKPGRCRHRAEDEAPEEAHFSNPGRTWAKTLERYRPGLVPFVLTELAGRYGRPTWERRLDPTSELILTILTQNSAGHERRGRLRGPARTLPGGEVPSRPTTRAPAGVATDCRTASHRTGPPSSSRRSPSWSTSSGPAASPIRRRHGSRRPCAGSARNVATTPWSSSATCPPSMRATG